MIDIKLRNVNVEDATHAALLVKYFMEEYSERRGISNGVGYGSRLPLAKFYVYRTDKTVICVGDYGTVDK